MHKIGKSDIQLGKVTLNLAFIHSLSMNKPKEKKKKIIGRGHGG